MTIPCVIFEDDHLLIVNKPAGLNTHAPHPFGGEGIYDWLRHREPRWANLAIIHRLDKETSGVMVFGKTALANRSLTEQFTQCAVRKKYFLLTDRRPKRNAFLVRSKIKRAANRYVTAAEGEFAETRFRVCAPLSAIPNSLLIEAKPLTGRTHQIRVHAAENGFPILGDSLYGGSPFARVCLHATEIEFHHPVTGGQLTFQAPVDFSEDVRTTLRGALIDKGETNAFRMIHGASDGWPGLYVDRLGEFALSHSARELTHKETDFSKSLVRESRETNHAPRSLYHKILRHDVRSADRVASSPRLVSGERAPDRFFVRENGLQFELSFTEGYSVGLFLDQRDTRRRLLAGHVAAAFELPVANQQWPNGNLKLEILNCFAYTCAFSVCAAKAGARVTSLDLSRKYLDWGARNFELNGLDPTEHDFIYGDVFDWLARLAKKGRSFDTVLLDPPTFSRSKKLGAFSAEKDYGKLISAALHVLRPHGVLFASTNATNLAPEKFLAAITEAIDAAGRKIRQQHYFPQPPDFPISKSEPAYLKTVWLRVE